MEIVRGAIVLAAGPGDYSGKPRPFLVVQSNVFNAVHGSVSMCPLTTHLGGEALFRVTFLPTIDTGLNAQSEVQVDKVQSLRRERVREVIGHAPAHLQEQVDQALRRWLDL